ncbi:MAG: type II toxin-antitoxin system RelE/ParE family toxin [Crenarchaeota archaeon]|nr:type II toxin-antitoxin system RelE/ParE family toxin [Thermoproteota archaeon]
MFTVKIKRKALKNLAKINIEEKLHLKETILLLKTDPLPFKKTDICKLKGYDNTYIIRIGTTRIVYDVLWKQKTVLIHYVGTREKAYS